MRTPATSSRHKILSLLAVVALVLGLVPALGSQAAAADEADGGALAEGGEPLSGLLASGSEGGAQSQVGGVGVGLAEGTGETFPEGAAEGSSDGSSQEVPLIAAAQLSREVALQPLSEGDGVPLVADVLAGKPTCFVSRDVPLAGDAEPVLGSFTVDGLTFAMTEEGEVELVAVAPGVLAGSLAAGEPGGSSEGIGSGVLASPQSSPEGAPSDGPESADGSSEPVALAVPGTVEHDGADYSVSSVGPRAFAGCDADVVSFPATVSSVDEAAFRGSLVGAVEVAEGNPHVASYEGVLYDADFSDLLLIPEGKEGAVRIHSNTSAITPGAFSHCASVTSVEVDAGNESFYVEDGVLCDADGNSIFDRLTMSFQDELGIGGNEDTVQSYGLTPGHPESGAVPQESFADLSSASNSRGFNEQTIVRVKGQTGGINWEDSRSTWRYSNSGYYYHVAAVGTQTYFPRSANSPGRILKGFALRNGHLCSPGSSWSIDGEFTVVWETKPHWTLTFDANGGAGGQASALTVYENEALPTIDPTAPTKAGYDFAGWFDAATGGIQYYDAACQAVRAWDQTRDITLFAQWIPKSYTCTFDKKGGTGGASSAAVRYGSSLPTVTKPALSGWTFQGYTDDFGTSTYQFVKASGAPTTRTWDYSSNKTLLANWTKTVNLNANNGTAGSRTSLTAGIGRPLGQKCVQVASSNADYPIRSLFKAGITDKSDWAPTRTGYTFAGYWSTSASTGGTCWITKDGVGSIVTSAIPSTLYARWTPNTYTVKFSVNGGAGSGYQTADKTATYGSAMPAISTTKPTRTGYTFMGWYDSANYAASGAKQYYTDACKSARSWDKASDATLYAGWKAIPYPISYDAADGELPEGARSSYTIEDGFDLPSPSRYGYQFEGWKVTGAEGSGVEDATAEDGSKVTRVKAGTYGDLVCTARWTLRYDLDVPVADPGEVTFEADSLTGQVRVRPGTSAEGSILSYMAVPVALDSLACEGLDSTGQPDAAGGAPELEAIFGAGSAAKVLFIATVGEGDAPHVAKLTAGGASGTASLAGLSVPAATSHDAPGRISVSYGLELDSGLAIPPVRDAAPVARLSYTVSLDRPGV